ncbi:hypothetical protein BC939DRAFT_20971 [Gamsiella multidivaricata]|uniref:uncharacterized protein n=1 Tax=Gamsiella multidivaricata TaxID=101098 RepID=UPI002220C57D|nr:uncharacterized protein BC939DRAFT_20971 [Gamsiella multidivaricata]KAI7816957.1 hypothetical protein BC939DRAFT_20971 [Gamsiella multidivaricata]
MLSAFLTVAVIFALIPEAYAAGTGPDDVLCVEYLFCWGCTWYWAILFSSWTITRGGRSIEVGGRRLDVLGPC